MTTPELFTFRVIVQSVICGSIWPSHVKLQTVNNGPRRRLPPWDVDELQRHLLLVSDLLRVIGGRRWLPPRLAAVVACWPSPTVKYSSSIFLLVTAAIFFR